MDSETLFLLFAVFPTIVGVIIIKVIKALKGGSSTPGKINVTDETAMIQEIYKGLERMEERVNTLETILLDHGYKDSKKL